MYIIRFYLKMNELCFYVNRSFCLDFRREYQNISFISLSICLHQLSVTGVLSRHTAPEKMAVDWLRKDITEAMATTNESSVLPCFQFNKFVDIEVKDDLQIQTLGWTNIEEAFDTGMGD